jgi:hypothetical protein
MLPNPLFNPLYSPLYRTIFFGLKNSAHLMGHSPPHVVSLPLELTRYARDINLVVLATYQQNLWICSILATSTNDYSAV